MEEGRGRVGEARKAGWEKGGGGWVKGGRQGGRREGEGG